MDVTVWLRSLGLGRYEAAFRENDIDETVLPGLWSTSGIPKPTRTTPRGPRERG